MPFVTCASHAPFCCGVWWAGHSQASALSTRFVRDISVVEKHFNTTVSKFFVIPEKHKCITFHATRFAFHIFVILVIIVAIYEVVFFFIKDGGPV